VLNPAISRDLETILLKCLSKEPQRRYASAQALADDLRAYLEDRPIAARRPNVAERAFRLVKKQRRSAVVAVVGAVAAVMLLSLGIVVWNDYQESFNGYLELTIGSYDRMGNEALRAEVLHEDGTATGSTFTVPNEQPVAQREGAYQLRLSAAGRASETYGFHLHAGSTLKTPVELTRGTFQIPNDQLPRPWNDWRTRLPVNDGPFVGGRVTIGETPKPPQDPLQSVLEKLGFVPVTEPRLVSTKVQADPAGRQVPVPDAVLLLRAEPNDYVTMLLVSLPSGETIWEKPLAAFWPRQMEGFPVTEPEWPLVEDLDGDGHAEIVVPEIDPVETETTLGVAVHELATGERPMPLSSEILACKRCLWHVICATC
jgi:hypothetical protein